MSCKAVKYEGLRRPQRFDAFKAEPPFLPLHQEDERRLWSPGGVLMIPEMIFLLPCKLFSTLMWPFFCLWYRVLGKTDIYSWSVPFSDPFIWLLIRRTSALDKQSVRVPKVPLRNSLLVPDDFTSVNRVLLSLFFLYWWSSFEPRWGKLLYLNDNTLFN